MSEQLDLFATLPAAGKSAAAPAETFGCCSRFRQCSDAGCCLISDQEYSVGCSYRKNLESGRVFYGKNAVGFVPSRYSEFRERIDKLSPAARTSFDAMVVDLFEYNCGAFRCIVRNEHISELSAVGLFEFHPLGSEFSHLCGYRSYLLPTFKDAPLFKYAQRRRKAEIRQLSTAISKAKDMGDAEELARLERKKKSIPGPQTRDFMIDWLNHDGAPLRDMLSFPYRIARFRSDVLIYLDVFYQDTLFSSCGSRIYAPSPLAVDGLLSPLAKKEEEVRRIKLSRGYSPEEKSHRLAALASNFPEDQEDTQNKTKKKTSVPSHENPLFGKTCVITGTLRIPRSKAFFEILKCGGQVSDRPVDTMDILIIGHQDWSEKNGGIASRKVQKAAELQSRAKTVQIISETELYDMVEKAVNSI